MADIVTSRIFTDGEKGITAAKLNDIIASSVIQPAFVSAKPPTSTVGATDQLLVLKSTGSYAQAPFQTVIDSVAAGLPSGDSEIWLVRQRSFNALGNPTFEVNQPSPGVTVTAPASGIARYMDRWVYHAPAAPASLSLAQGSVNVAIPGSNFLISQNTLKVTLLATKASLAATDYLSIYQTVEGPCLRELLNDVHSISLVVRSSVANLLFGVAISDPTGTRSLTKLCTIPASNTWTSITLPNIPIWPAAGAFGLAPGSSGYILNITLAAGTTFTANANDTWQNGNFVGANGQGNFCGQAVNATFEIGFIQHEPGAVCSTPMDKPFGQNYDECLRYFQKTYNYETAIAAATAIGVRGFVTLGATGTAFGTNPFHKPMVKTPAIAFYNYATGAISSVRDSAGADHGGAAVNQPGSSGFSGLSFSPATSGALGVFAHYIADTSL